MFPFEFTLTVRCPRFMNLRSFGTTSLYVCVAWVSTYFSVSNWLSVKKDRCLLSVSYHQHWPHHFPQDASITVVKPERISVIINNSSSFLVGISKSILIT